MAKKQTTIGEILVIVAIVMYLFHNPDADDVCIAGIILWLLGI